MCMTAFQQWVSGLYEFLKDQGTVKKQADLGELTGVKQGTVSRWLDAKKPMDPELDSIEAANAVARKYGYPTYGSKAADMQRMIPIVGRVGAGAVVIPFGESSGQSAESPGDAKPGTVAVEVDGDSMFPAYEDGAILYYSDQLPPEAMINRRCIVALADGRMYVKVLRQGSMKGLWTLQSLNPLYPDMKDEDVDWAAKIDWVKPR